MGIKPVEYYLRQIIEDSIDRIRKNPDIIDDIFEDLKCPPLNNKFGDKLIDEIKCFFNDNNIPVRSAWSSNQPEVPSISIHLINSQVAQEYRSMQDHVEYFSKPTERAVIYGPFFGLSYDPSDGKIVTDKNVDFSMIDQGNVLKDVRNDKTYTVSGSIFWNEPNTPSYELTNQYFHIIDEDGLIPERVDVAELQIVSDIDYKKYRRQSSIFEEVFEITGIASTNSDHSVWLYYLISYVFLKNKQFFEEVGLELQSHSASESRRDTSKTPNNIWSRSLRVTFTVQHTWIEEVKSYTLGGINIIPESNVTVEEM